jgi:hypothetical protein
MKTKQISLIIDQDLEKQIRQEMVDNNLRSRGEWVKFTILKNRYLANNFHNLPENIQLAQKGVSEMISESITGERSAKQKNRDL